MSFFGWIAVNNAARIAADWATGHADSWDGMPATAKAQGERDRYEELILNDLQALNCELPTPTPVGDPAFAGFDDGDLVQVTLECSFELLTPLAESVLSGPVSLDAQAQFAVYKPIDATLPPPPPPPPDPSTPAIRWRRRSC